METFTIIGEEFEQGASGNSRTKVKLMWGGNELDRSNTNFWNATFKGDIVYDPNFSLNFHTVEN